MTHAIVWHTAHPLWPVSMRDAGASPIRFRVPALLRFVGDDYMQQLQGTLAGDPESLAGYVARAESFEVEQAGWLVESEAAAASPLRLFHPAHYRYYLVAASLVCQQPGLPDRSIDAAELESCSFVMRRLAPRTGRAFDRNDASTYDELAWSGTAQQGLWRPVQVRDGLAPNEERLALFPKTFKFESADRRLLAGMIPVARRDVYQAGITAVAAPASAALLRADTFSSEAAATAFQRIEKALEELRAAHDAQPTAAGSEPGLLELKTIAFAHALLDVVDFLDSNLRSVRDALPPGSPTASLTATQAAVLAHLDRSATPAARTFRAILLDVAGLRGAIEDGSVTAAAVQGALGAPLTRGQLGDVAERLKDGSQLRARLVAALDPRATSFQRDVLDRFGRLGDAGLTDAAAQDALLDALLALAEFLRTELPQAWTSLETGGTAPSSALRGVVETLAQPLPGRADWRSYLLDAEAHRAEILAGHVTPAVRVVADRLRAVEIATAVTFAATLGPAIAAALAAVTLPDQATAKRDLAAAPPPSPDAPAWYRIRCVYERPKCAPVHGAIVSEPSAPFQLASFFEADAPVRPIRIQMPDASLSRLRRSAKGVAIATSKELRAQVDRVRNAGLKGLIDQDVGAGQSFDFGLICQLSIPIITICAFILLMLIVQLLNIVFFWVPFFILCLPRIGKKA